jgi:hypothetical protein
MDNPLVAVYCQRLYNSGSNSKGSQVAESVISKALPVHLLRRHTENRVKLPRFVLSFMLGS